MPAKLPTQGPAHKYEELVRQVADSETFRSAPTMRVLLLYLWQHQGESISEYAIATDALGRGPDFDPKLDSTVRVQVARLRAKLKGFYEADDDHFPLRLTLPRGRHELEWIYQPHHKSIASRLAVIPKPYWWAIGMTQLLLMIACAVLLNQNRGLRASIPDPAPPMPRLWQSFLVAGKTTVIVVPNPLHFHWPAQQVSIRDLRISDYPDWPNSPFLKQNSEKWGPPELAQIYVGAMEMTAGVRLLQYLERGGQRVQLTESRRFPAELFGAQNTIFLGMPRTAGYLNKILEKTNFYIAQVTPDVIRNRNPKPGEPLEFREVSYSVNRRLAPGIIIMLPARPERSRTMLLWGRHLTSLTSILVTPEGLKLVEEAWLKNGSPDAWEMVIQAEIFGDTILKTVPMAARPIAANFWK